MTTPSAFPSVRFVPRETRRSELLEVVPGMIATRYSGDDKANQ